MGSFSDGQFHTVAFLVDGSTIFSYTEWFSNGQFHTMALVVDGSAVTQSGLVIDSFIQWISWWTVRQLHRVV